MDLAAGASSLRRFSPSPRRMQIRDPHLNHKTALQSQIQSSPCDYDHPRPIIYLALFRYVIIFRAVVGSGFDWVGLPPVEDPASSHPICLLT